ncbi:cupin domain-containing protein [Streptacidiphilus jiangxiensis]|uniref:cupin domain-containing protein n=1 Tax=Streptacidiphilus jiangxiensis TaxID=235985 RepID=UPI001F487BA7|nr:cupin domain-containing protein [Streptacidiphilus jiangxiensis]
MLRPLDPASFKREYWERKPLVVHREDPDYYADPLTLHDVDRILSTSSIRSSDLRLVVSGREIPLAEMVASGPGGQANALEVLYEQYRQGSTVVFKFLHERWEPLGALVRALSEEFSAAMQANAYLTPAGQQGLHTHYDTHDVFVLQIWGSKHWRLYDSPTRLPLTSQPYVRPQGGPGEPVQEFDLRAGDLMYMPRGTVHDATSNGEASLHLTVGVLPVLYATLLREALDQVLESDPRYREALPPGFVGDEALRQEARRTLDALLRSVPDAAAPEGLIDRAVSRALVGRQPVLRGHLVDLERLSSLETGTRVRRRSDLLWQLTEDSAGVRLEFHGKVLRFPAKVAEDVRFAVSGEGSFTPASLPGRLDDEGRLVLVRRLLREGLLTLG